MTVTDTRISPAAAAVDAYEVLRSAIIGGQLQPSERLVEADISVRFALRPAAVRKALLQLEHEGVVERERFRGARVRRFTQSEVKEVLEASAALKVVAVRLAAARATPQQIEQLRETIAKLARSYEARQLLDGAHLTSRLHHQLLEISGQSVIQRISATLSAQMARVQYETVLLAGASDESLHLQEQIVEAVASGDEDRAEAAMRAHFALALNVLYTHGGHWAYGTIG